MIRWRLRRRLRGGIKLSESGFSVLEDEKDKIQYMELDDITYKIIGAAMKVHDTLGNEFQEVIYQRCLAIELVNAGLDFGRELEDVHLAPAKKLCSCL